MVEEGIKRFLPIENELLWRLPSRTKIYEKVYFLTMTHRQQRTVIPERKETNEVTL